MIFEPTEKQVRVGVAGTDEEGLVELLYRTTAGKAMDRLNAKGLTPERIQEFVKPILGEPEQAFTGDPDDAEFIVEVSQVSGSAEAGELAVLWHALGHAKSDDPVVFDPADALDYETVEEVLGRDFLFEARDDLRRRIHLTGALFDFVIKTKPEAIQFIKEKMKRLSEDEFIGSIVVPILKAEGYENVKPTVHGPGEFGSDTLPMRRAELGKWFYYGAQAKVQRIGQTEAASQVTAQLRTALSHSFSDSSDNVMKKLDFVYLFLGQGATNEAIQVFVSNFPNSVRVFDESDIAELVLKHNLLGNLP